MTRLTGSWALTLALCALLRGMPLQGQTSAPVLPPPATGGVPGPLERSAVAITTDNPLPRRIATTLPEYPSAARQTGRRGTITLRVTVDQAGRHAFLFVTHTCGGDCGTGHFVTLTREDQWRLVKSYLAFIS